MLETLEVNSEVLDNIHEEFKATVFSRGIKIHSFQEAQGISGMKGVERKVRLFIMLYHCCHIYSTRTLPAHADNLRL